MNTKFLQGFVAALVVITIVGCSSILKNNEGVFGKQSKTTDKIQNELRATENAQAQSNEDRLAHIGAYAKGGVEHALDKVPSTNMTPEITVAKEMNERVEALAGKPDFKEVEAIRDIVDKLTSANKEIQKQGEKLLASKDKEINRLEEAVKDLNNQREKSIADLNVVADANAAKADQYKATLSQMDRFFGLGAVFYGLKKFLISSMWILGIGGVLFVILRIASLSNPIAASVFSIFSQIGSWFIHIIEFIVPKAAEIAGHTATTVFNAYKSTLTKVVDAIQMEKERAAASGKPADIGAILDDVAKSMNGEEKAIVDELKKALNWKQ